MNVRKALLSIFGVRSMQIRRATTRSQAWDANMATDPTNITSLQAAVTAKAREAAQPGDWLSAALDQHDLIRSAFEAVAEAGVGHARLAAFRSLSLLLNAHVIAEEAVLYPALLFAGHQDYAETAFAEQTTVKIQLAAITGIDISVPAWMSGFEDIRREVLEHMLKEEGSWFLQLRAQESGHGELTTRFIDEFGRYRQAP